MKRFEIGAGVTCDLDRLVDTRLLVQANSGGGKSWLLRRLLEQTHGHVQHLVIDPEGEFASLRERFDYVLAAKSGGDTAADPRSAALLAERLLELKVSAILDIYELKPHERIVFVRRFLEALIDAPKSLWHPALVVVDEAHVYCPQVGDAESAGAVKDLATRGRKRGFCAVLATQRLSKLHKDAAAECNNKLIGRTSLDVDMVRGGDELGFVKEARQELRRLDAGQFYAFGPAFDGTKSIGVTPVQVGPVETTHPKAGARLAFTAPPPTSKVKALLPKLADLPAEAEERVKSVDTLKREVAQLRRDLTAAVRAQPPAPKAETKTVEKFVLKDGQLARAEKLAETVNDKLFAVDSAIGRVHALAQELRAATKEIADAIATTRAPHTDAPGGGPRLMPLTPSKAMGGPRPVAQPARPAREGDVHVSRPQQEILDALAWLESVQIPQPRRGQVALVARVSSASSGYEKNLSTLRTSGLIEYPGQNLVALTPDGRGQAVAPDVPPSIEDLHEALYARVSRPQADLLRVIIGAHPTPLSREILAASALVSAASSGFEKNVSTLRSLGLFDYPQQGLVSATPVLFLEGR